MVTNVYTVNSKAAAQVVNDFEFVGDDAKIKKVIGNDLEAYKKFYGSDPVVPMEEVVKRSKKK